MDTPSYESEDSNTPPTPIDHLPSMLPSMVELHIAQSFADYEIDHKGSKTVQAYNPVSILDTLATGVNLTEMQEFMINLCKTAGIMMKKADPSVDSSLAKKNSADRVTETDRAIEAMVKTAFHERYPNYSFFGEETCKIGQKLGNEPTLVCDPIDGTLNFIHGFPNYAISLALCIHKKPYVSTVYNPARGDLFTAIKGFGSFWTKFDGTVTKLPVKGRPQPIDSLNSCLVALEWGNDRKSSNWHLRTHMVEQMLGGNGAMAHSQRSSGSAALDFCYVAAGCLDLFWEGGCWIWDVAGGWLIVEEAGGIVVGANPGQWKPSLEGRSYFAIRGAPHGQEELAEELWGLMGGRRFSF